MVNEIEKSLINQLIIPREQKLLSLLFNDKEIRVEIENVLENLNIDTENHNYLLMLAYVGFKVNWIGFSEKIIPQIKGVYRYYQVQNALLMQKLFLYTHKLNEKNIIPLVLKGTAMRLHYAPGVSRMMADSDLAIFKDDYNNAIAIAHEMGGTCLNEADHAITYRLGQSEMDIHRFIFKNNIEKNSDIWTHIETIEVNGCRMNVLSPIDMFLHILDTQSRCIFVGEMTERRMKWLYDAKMVLNNIPNIDWAVIAKRADQLNCSYRVHLMMKLFSSCFPEMITLKSVESIFKVDEGYSKWLNYAKAYINMLESYRRDRNITEKTVTLKVIFLRMKHLFLWKEYRYYAPELRKIKKGMNFIRYTIEHFYLNRPALFYQNYLSRLRLRR